MVAKYLTFLPEAADQRDHSLREMFNGLRYVVKMGRVGARCRTTCRLVLRVSADSALACGRVL